MGHINDVGRGAGSDPAASGEIVIQHDFHGSGVRAIVRGSATWFVAADVCGALHLKNPRYAVSRLDEDEKGVGIVDTLGGSQEMVVVTESGLFALVLRSRKPQARAFRRWVTGEVIPSIRRTGAYSIGGTPASEPKQDFREPGRYVTMVFPEQNPHTQRYRLEALLNDVAENDCTLMALALKTTEAWWHKTEQLAAVALETRGSFAAVGLERAIREGAELADRLLNAQRQEQARQDGLFAMSQKS